MINKLNELNQDIKRCEDVLIENNYLEIVITIEELHDKYKNDIVNISNIDNSIVWNYSKKDIQNILNYLKDYKDEIIFENNQKNIEEKIKELKTYIQKNDILEKNKLIEAINIIKNINSNDLDLNIKWKKLQSLLDLIQNQEREIGIKLLEIIVLVSK
nr:hypothetical protein [uncultured Romboutsia sp.]